MRTLRYALDEALASLWRRRGANVLSVLTITIALFVLGVFLLVNSNVQRWLAQWNAAAEFSVYLDPAVTPDQRSAIEHVLSSSRVVATTEFVSAIEAMRRFAKTFPELARSARDLGEHPLPPSFEVRLRPGAGEGAELEQLAAQLGRLPGVSDVRYDRRWIQRLTTMARAGGVVGAVLAGLLVLAAALTVASVVRLALHARRDEIEIMHLVGAPLSFIRGPFILEGVLHGGVGAVVALIALYVLFAAGRMQVAALASPISGSQAELIGFLPATWTLGLIAGGMFVGCIGGVIAARSAR
jgi:cell division transport system permease protein